ncbi:MAG: hypothetical protein LWX56_05280 [Ignavibacteria bacterium]|nr:hypothetical protein [Ignavibacteria bacterium]
MEWVILISWLSIINGALGGQYILNWMGNQPKFVGDKQVGVSPGIMTFWREVSKLLWAVIAVFIELVRGKQWKYLWPGMLSLTTLIICAFTGVIENIGFFYLPRYYSPHLYAPYVNIYLAFLPFWGKLLFNAPIRKEHYAGISLVVLGLAFPHVPRIFGIQADPSTRLDFTAILWIVIINICLMSQQVLNNKTVQTALPNVGANALVVWREIWKLIFIVSAVIIFPIFGSMLKINMPEKVEAKIYETQVLVKLDSAQKQILALNYSKVGQEYKLRQNATPEDLKAVETCFKTAEYHRFFSLFDGSILPKNWWPILFVVLAGLTGYIYSFGFFKLSRFAAHFWVPYTNVYLALLPFIMMLFGKDVTPFQIGGAIIVTAGLMVGVSDYSRNKVEEIEKKHA